MLKLGIIGCGALGTEVVKAVKEGILRYRIVALYDKKVDYSLKLAEYLGNLGVSTRSFEEFLARDPDVVVEVASPEAVRQFAVEILKRNKIFVVMSSGGLLNDELFSRIVRLVRSGYGSLVVPSGAIGGIDIIKSLSLTSHADVRLITIKNALSFRDEYLARVGISKEEITSRTLLFAGPANKAVVFFPTMINVAATISLALGKIINVEIYADPNIETTIHEIIVESEAVNAKIVLKNKHHPNNPRTSYLAALSLIETLKKLTERIVVGT